MHVIILAMASPILVRYVCFTLMFNVVWSQISLPTKVISTDLSSPTQAMNRVAVVVVLKVIKYSIVPFVNLH